MKSLPERIMEHAEATPEATPICPTALLHLGKQGAVNQALEDYILGRVVDELGVESVQVWRLERVEG